jgi:hypothetical protein
MTIQEIKKELSSQWKRPKAKNAKGAVPRDEQRIQQLYNLQRSYKGSLQQAIGEKKFFTGIV